LRPCDSRATASPSFTFRATRCCCAPSCRLHSSRRRSKSWALTSSCRDRRNSSSRAGRSSFYALEIARATGTSDQEGALRKQTAQWLTAMAPPDADSDAQADPTQAFFVLALAAELQLAPSPGVVATLTARLEDSTELARITRCSCSGYVNCWGFRFHRRRTPFLLLQLDPVN
jgi:hypothetical protein